MFALLLFSNMFLPMHVARAGVWGESIAATLLDQSLTTIKNQIEGAILGTLKVAAITMLNSKVGQMVGGSSAGSSLIISDWNQFLYQAPAEKVSVYMNDFFTNVTRGKYASANYVGVGDPIGNIGGNYVAYLVDGAKGQISPGSDSLSSSPCDYNLDEYADNPSTIFDDGNWQGFNAFFQPCNNPFGFQIATMGVYSQKLIQEQEQAKIESLAPGFKAAKVNGNTVTPVATIQGMVNDTQNIGNQLVAVAKNPSEFLSGVVGALVNKTITNLVQRGVGKVQANIKREIGNFDQKVSTALNKANKKLGPAAAFLKDASQRMDTQVKPYTAPPPAAGSYCDGGC